MQVPPGQALRSTVKRLVDTLKPRPRGSDGAQIDALVSSIAAQRDELSGVRAELDRLNAAAGEAQSATAQLIDACQREIHTRAQLAALPRARLRADAVLVEGSAAQRLRMRRLTVGSPLQRRFSTWMGVTQCSSTDNDVRASWDGLLQAEVERGDVLEAGPCIVLDIPGAVVSRRAATLHVAFSGRQDPIPASMHLDERGRSGEAIWSVPRFAYGFPARKLRNFGHWLLDCCPQVVALATVAPGSVFLLPEPLAAFHRSTLSLVGLTPPQMFAWDGAPVRAQRLLVLESDGRSGGGRPLSALIDMRRLLSPARPGAPASARRRVYVSRRDARSKRRWMANEPAVEALFRSRGFEVLVMAECPLPEQVATFREAGVVAGISGAGLADIVFSSAGTHVIVLLSDSLIRWYADEIGQRSAWIRGPRQSRGRLAALGDSPRFYAHLAAAFEQYCHCFVGSDEMPLDRLAGFVDEVLARVGEQ